jgi:hypothetical protein
VFCLGPTWRGDTEYELWDQERYYLKLLRQIAKLHAVPLLELSEQYYPEFRDPFYYADPDHLNVVGARHYSRLAAMHINEIKKFKSVDQLMQSPYYPKIDPKDYIRG